MTSNPRREWKSFSCVCRCSVRFLMRSDSNATCTSGAPVFLPPSPCSLISSCLRSTVIDIGFSPYSLEVQYPHRNQLACLEPGQGNEPALRHGADHAAGSKLVNTVAVLSVEQSNRLSRPKADRLGGRQSQGRDVVQRGFDGQKVLKSGGTMPQGLQRFQRNRPLLRERPDGGAPQVPDMGASP